MGCIRATSPSAGLKGPPHAAATTHLACGCSLMARQWDAHRAQMRAVFWVWLQRPPSDREACWVW